MSELTIKVAALQMVSGSDLEQNLREVGRLLGLARNQGAQIAVLPENFALLDTRQLRLLAEEEHRSHKIQQQLAYLAQQYGLALILGTLPCHTRPQGDACAPGKVRAAVWFMDPRGQLLARYDKIHLFDADIDDPKGRYKESDHFEAGDQPVTLDYLGVRFGFSVCYDLRFPSLYQALFQSGAEVLLVPAAFTQVTGEAHWQPLLRARAIETQSYVVGANQGGVHGEGRTTYGHSMIVDPWGQVLGEMNEGPGVICADIDLGHLRRVRRRMPIRSHTKFNVNMLDT